MILRERIGKKRKGKPKQLVVIVPAGWKFIEKVKLRNETLEDQICELIANWDYITVFTESGVLPEDDIEDPDLTTYTFRPWIKYIWAMADENHRRRWSAWP